MVKNRIAMPVYATICRSPEDIALIQMQIPQCRSSGRARHISVGEDWIVNGGPGALLIYVSADPWVRLLSLGDPKLGPPSD